MFVCLFVLFFHPLGCVLRVRKECEIPPARDEKNHKMILMAMSSLVGWDSGGRPAGIYTDSAAFIFDNNYLATSMKYEWIIPK